MPSSPLADLLNNWAAQADDARRTGAAANIISQYSIQGQPGQPQQAPQPAQQQGGFLSNLIGLTSAQPQPASQPVQDGGFFSRLLGIGGQQPADQPLNLQSATTPQLPSVINSPGGASAPGSSSLGGPPQSGTALSFGPGGAGGGPQATPSMSSDLSAPVPTPRPASPSFAPAPAGPLPTFAAAGGAPGQDNTSRALAFYQSKGLSPIAASALVGGFHAESGKGLNTNATNVGDGSDGSNSIGIAQWNGDRARGLQQFAASNGLNPADIDTQLQYSWLELNGPEKGTLQALQSAQNPAQATAAALGYERPAGWSAQNPYGAKTFGSRLKNTVGLASTGFNTPFDGSQIGPSTSGFTPSAAQGGLPMMAATGQGMNLSPATPFPAAAQRVPTTPPAPLPLAGSGGTSTSGGYVAYDSRGKAVKTDVDGNALDADGRPTTLAYGGVPAGVTAAPAARAIAAAAPAGDPLVTVPGYSGQWNRSRIAAAPDGTDVPDDGELARAQTGGTQAVQVPRGNALAASAAPSSGVPAVPAAAAGVMPQQSQSPYQITPPMIQALLHNPDTQAFGIDMWKALATSKKAPIVQDGYVLDGNSGALLYALPQRPQQTDAIKNFQYGQTNPAFQQYQDDQKSAEKGQIIDVPLPNGQFQKTWITPGQAPAQGVAVGAPYVPRPGTSVTIDQKAESAQEGEYGKVAGQQLGEVMKAGATAPQALQQVAMLRAAAAQAGDNLSTGPFGPFALKAKQALGNALGVEIPGTKEGEVINNIGYGLATQAARAISNRPTQMEFANALSVKPGLSLSPQGMTAVLNIREQDLKDQVALAKLASDRNNRNNWPAVVADYYDQHPVMSPFDPSRPLGAQDVQAINGSQQAAAPSTISAQDAASLPVISSPEAAGRLKPGTLFKTPDGRIKQR